MEIREVLRQYQPIEWEYASYQEHLYHTFLLSNYDPEWDSIVRAFDDSGIIVKSLKRVQNPYQLGMFTEEKIQKEFINEQADTLKYYHPIHRSDLKTALEYNMDVRRYGQHYSGNHVGNKYPKFFKKPRAASDAIPECSNKVILVCAILGSRFNEPRITSKSSESEYMPTYVVAIRN